MQEEVSAVKSDNDVLEENADMYRMFITGMLMNQGGMPLKRILDMLKIALPGGFPFGPNELKGLLQGMADESKLVVNGDAYSIVK
jgi:anaphase-promoting complex subunit 2